MTDARLPGYWLTELRFTDMDDRTWRIFTGALMWCAEQGTDGAIEERHFRFLYADGLTKDDIDALMAAELVDRTETGIQLRGWSDDRGLRQSLDATVRGYRDRKRRNQADYRERLRSRSESGDVTGHMTEHVGEGSFTGGDFSIGASAYVTGHATCSKHPDGNSDAPCFGCMKAREARESSDPKPATPGVAERCASGKHRWLADGTCNHCTTRRVPTNEEFMYR